MDNAGIVELKRCESRFDIRIDPTEMLKLIKEVVVAVSKAKGCEVDLTTIDFWSCTDGPLAKIKNSKHVLDDTIYFEAD